MDARDQDSINTPKPQQAALGLTASAIASLVRGELSGNPEMLLRGIAPLDEASAADLSFLFASAPRELRKLKELALKTEAGAILIAQKNENLPLTQIVVKHPLLALTIVAKAMYRKPTPAEGRHPSAIIDDTADIHPTARIGALSVIGANVRIGENTIVFPHVVIYDGAVVGSNCVLHANAVLRENVVVQNDCVIQNGAVVGSDGFGYIPIPNVGLERIPHVGSVVLENSVDLGANTTIDRGTYGTTHICAGAKIDNLVMVGHNVKIGSGSILCGQVGVAGSTQVGSGVILAGQVGVADHVQIANNVRVAAKSGIASSLEKSGDYAGIPAREARQWRREQVIIGKMARGKVHESE
jgi:UDP-3-O-[3-hydroxymyristoyl] glucosamine N-acyltransferase